MMKPTHGAPCYGIEIKGRIRVCSKPTGENILYFENGIERKENMKTFAEIEINADILKGLDGLGFSVLTPVQEKIIPIVLKRQVDLVGLAQTGTGKTAAFGIPLIQLTDTHRKQTQALILCPTRELCVQVARDLTVMGRYVPGLKIVAVYGGANIVGQIDELRRGAQIIVATPGRLYDLIRRGSVDLSALRWVVLDEADEMLQMGFQEELNAILAFTPDSKNTLLFSATMSGEVAKIAGNYMKDPIEITVGHRNAGAENVHHIYYVVADRNRYQALRRIADINPDIYSIIFCRTRLETREVVDKLIEDGYSADALHGDLSQSQRDHVMHKFRSKNIRMLVATDVAARGLDVNDLTHIINYNLPDELSGYTHRSGRTGRAGKTGISIALIGTREKYKIREIERNLKKNFEEGRIPSGHEICKKRLLSQMEAVKQVEIDSEQIDPFLPSISRTLESLDREELIKRFVSIEFNRFLESYRNAPDLNVFDKESPRKRVRETTGKPYPYKAAHQKFTHFLIKAGKKDGISPKRLMRDLSDAAGMPDIRIGKIEVLNNTSLLEADNRFARKVMLALQAMTINGRCVDVEIERKTDPRRKAEDGHYPQGVTKYKRKGQGRPS